MLVVAQATSRLTSAHKPTIVFFFEEKVVLWPADEDEDAMEEELVVEVEAVMVVKQSMPKNFALQGVSSTTNFFQKMTPTKREAKREAVQTEVAQHRRGRNCQNNVVWAFFQGLTNHNLQLVALKQNENDFGRVLVFRGDTLDHLLLK